MRDRLPATALAALAVLLAAACAGPPGPGAGAPEPTVPTAPEPTVPTAPEPTVPTAPEPEATPEPPVPAVTPSGPFPAATVELHPATGAPVTVAVHVAARTETRRRGLMGREEVPAGTGMLFLFPADTEGGFWMKDTLVPLSIAFADGGGRIVRVLDMEPCEADPCPAYRPGATYRVALEVPAGYFDEVGVGEGDLLVLPDDLPDPR